MGIPCEVHSSVSLWVKTTCAENMWEAVPGPGSLSSVVEVKTACIRLKYRLSDRPPEVKAWKNVSAGKRRSLINIPEYQNVKRTIIIPT
jgi:hypothetical protein